jgi:hypothetical protein
MGPLTSRFAVVRAAVSGQAVHGIAVEEHIPASLPFSSGRLSPTSPMRTRKRTDTGRPDARMSTLDTGHRRVDLARVDTGRRTLAEDRTGEEGVAGIRTSWATMPSGRPLGRRTVFLWTVDGAYRARQP